MTESEAAGRQRSTPDQTNQRRSPVGIIDPEEMTNLTAGTADVTADGHSQETVDGQNPETVDGQNPETVRDQCQGTEEFQPAGHLRRARGKGSGLGLLTSQRTRTRTEIKTKTKQNPRSVRCW